MDDGAELGDIGERNLIERILSTLSAGPTSSIGDDAAYIELGDETIVLTSDIVSRANHMPEGASFEQLGWYSAAVNLSDIAAMGAKPLGLFLAMSLPPKGKVTELDDLVKGIANCAQHYNVPIIGGDTKGAADWSITISALGKVKTSDILLRSGARSGDIIAVSGTLGRSGAGLSLIEQGKITAVAMEAVMRPNPRLALGRMLAKQHIATSCIDISDGLALSVHYLSEASKRSFEIQMESIPKDPLLTHLDATLQDEHLLYSGGDFELLLTLDPMAYQRNIDEISSSLTIIGTVGDGTENTLSTAGATTQLEKRGFEHLRK